MSTDELVGQPGYRQGLRDGIGIVVRGLLRVEADEVDVGALIGSLSRFEEALEAWRDSGDASPAAPSWEPTADELGAEPAEE